MPEKNIFGKRIYVPAGIQLSEKGVVKDIVNLLAEQSPRRFGDASDMIRVRYGLSHIDSVCIVFSRALQLKLEPNGIVLHVEAPTIEGDAPNTRGFRLREGQRVTHFY